MGIYDRDYYRKEGPSFLESFAGRADVCKWLIIINACIFVLQLITRPANHFEPDLLEQYFALNVYEVQNGQVWRLLTYAFLHADPFHILFNMLFLWWFGKDVEELYGGKEFLAFYLTAAVAGGIAFAIGRVTVIDYGNPRTICVGASGAVTAALILCACHYPTKVILIAMVPVPIWLFVLFSIGMDIIGVMGVGGNTAYTAHLGGAAFGLIYYKMQPRRILNLWPDFKGWQKARSRPQLRVYRGDDDAEQLPMPTPVPAAGPADDDEDIKSQMDAVLDKVHRSGKESLTPEENDILMRASEYLRNQRR